MFLQLTGGECTLHPEFVTIYKDIKFLGIIPSVSTNATLISKEIVDLFTQYPPRLIKISLYGSNKNIHDKVTCVGGSFERTIAGARALKQAGLRVMFSSVLFKDNIEDQSNIAKLADTLEIPVHFYSQLIPRLNGSIDFADRMLTYQQSLTIPPNKVLDFYPVFKKNSLTKFDRFNCNAGTNSFHIDSEGKMFMCKVDRTKGFPLTSLSFREAWLKLNKHANQVLQIPGACVSCGRRNDCSICPAKLHLAQTVVISSRHILDF